jgi:hypothetical protein
MATNFNSHHHCDPWHLDVKVTYSGYYSEDSLTCCHSIDAKTICNVSLGAFRVVRVKELRNLVDNLTVKDNVDNC